MANVLIMENDIPLGILLKREIVNAGHHVDVITQADTPEESSSILRADLVLLNNRCMNDGGWKIAPHVHVILTARGWRSGGGRRPGQRNIAWLGRETQRRELRQAWSDATGIYPTSYSAAA